MADILTEQWACHYNDLILAGKNPDDEIEDPDYESEVEEFMREATDEDFEDMP